MINLTLGDYRICTLKMVLSPYMSAILFQSVQVRI